MCPRQKAARLLARPYSKVAWQKEGTDLFSAAGSPLGVPATLSSAPPTGFALHGELLSLVWPRESNQREGHPGIRVWPAARLPSLRCCSGGRLTRAIPGPLSGAPSPLTASMRLAPCATAPLGLLAGSESESPESTSVILCTNHQTLPNAPFRRVSGIDVEGVERHDAARDAMGQGWPIAACPWSGDGTNVSAP